MSGLKNVTYIYVCVCVNLRWMAKECELHTHKQEYYSATSFKMKETLPLVTTQMSLEGIMLSEISQTEKYKYYMASHICYI